VSNDHFLAEGFQEKIEKERSEQENKPPPQPGQRGYAAHKRLVEMQSMATPDFERQQIIIFRSITLLRIDCKFKYNMVSERDKWTDALGDPKHPEYAFKCLFLLVCSAGIADKTLCKFCKVFFAKPEFSIDWIYQMKEEDLADHIKTLSCQNKNAQNIKAIVKDIVEK